jgi:hypothetical protein
MTNKTWRLNNLIALLFVLFGLMVSNVQAQGIDEIPWIGIATPADDLPHVDPSTPTYEVIGEAPDGGFILKDAEGNTFKAFCTDKGGKFGKKYVKQEYADKSTTGIHISVNDPEFAQMTDKERQNFVWLSRGQNAPMTDLVTKLLAKVNAWQGEYLKLNVYVPTKCNHERCQAYIEKPTPIPTVVPPTVVPPTVVPPTQQPPQPTVEPTATATSQPEPPQPEGKGWFDVCPWGCPGSNGWVPSEVRVVMYSQLPGSGEWVRSMPPTQVEGGLDEPNKNSGIPRIWVQHNLPSGSQIQIAVLDNQGKLIASPKVIHIVGPYDGGPTNPLHTADIHFGDISKQLFTGDCNKVCYVVKTAVPPTSTPEATSTPETLQSTTNLPTPGAPQGALAAPELPKASNGKANIWAELIGLIIFGLIVLGTVGRPVYIKIRSSR